MSTWFISRHPGAQAWAREQGIDAQWVRHLDPAILAAGDVVMGTLPIGLAAEACARGARLWHLDIDLPESARGQELDADALRRFGARLVEYRVMRV